MCRCRRSRCFAPKTKDAVDVPIITLNTAVPKGCLQIYNDLNHDLYNLLFCVKHRPMALTKELSFLPINARDEFDVLRRQLQGEDFTQL